MPNNPSNVSNRSELPIAIGVLLFCLVIAIGAYRVHSSSKSMLSEGPALRREFDEIQPPHGAEPAGELKQNAKYESALIVQSYRFIRGTELLIPFYDGELSTLGWSQLRQQETSADYCKGAYMASLTINKPDDGNWSYSFAIARSASTENQCSVGTRRAQ